MDKLDDAQSLKVQAVGGHLVSHSLGAAAADAEHHDCLEEEHYQNMLLVHVIELSEKRNAVTLCVSSLIRSKVNCFNNITTIQLSIRYSYSYAIT